MKSFFYITSIAFIALILYNSCNHSANTIPQVLLFTNSSVAQQPLTQAGVQAIIKLGKENNFRVDTTSDVTWFTEDTLKKYTTIIFFHTTGASFDKFQAADFERFIQAGGGFVGIHAASDKKYNWTWYGELIGGYFSGMPSVRPAVLQVVDSSHFSTKHLAPSWKKTDAWYRFKMLNTDIRVLLTLNEDRYHNNKNKTPYPISWYHKFDGGRVWYTDLGNIEEAYQDPAFLAHLSGGIQYAIGKNRKLNYNKATTKRAQDRFTKTQLVKGTFFEPTEMTILPNLDILIIQRRGEILLYKNKDQSIKQVCFLDVFWKNNNPKEASEEGVLGIQKDPDFANNHYVYIYYSPKDVWINRLSRFTFENDTLTSEKIILQLQAQREMCCHTAGSITFGKDRMLYLSTGDNTDPLGEGNWGFGPVDDRPGQAIFDSQRTASNTNDLRGKILRIKIKEDGSYEIPEGNLFPRGNPKARPEIYIMGVRNPYRISIDPKTGFLYWGDVGPDATDDSLQTRGPRGYDEINQARQAGNFGWPLFIGNNYPYRQFDHKTGKYGPNYDPVKPFNQSLNNTGLRDLPPAQAAFIWYPYAESPDFPQVGSGNRNAMAGPIYYKDLYPEATRMPDYYNGKFFIYDWMRGWIKVVSMLPNGAFQEMESFLPHTSFNGLIDLELGPDGKLYGLEYGNGWYTKNRDAGLFRIDYNQGNMPPKIEKFTVDRNSGKLPLNIILTVQAKDPENKHLRYIWQIGEQEIVTHTPILKHTLTKIGDYPVSVEVRDNKNGTIISNTLHVYAGNQAPVVRIQILGNQMFYFPNKPVQYAVTVEDDGVKDLRNLMVVADYLEGTNESTSLNGHQILSKLATGKNLMESLDCKACHKTTEQSIGPSYTAVAQRYQKTPNARAYLVNKILKGGTGVWGERIMAPHPNVSKQDAQQIVAWIQSLATREQAIQSLPASGSVRPSPGKALKDKGLFYIKASYTDEVAPDIKPLRDSSTVVLRNSKLSFEKAKGLATQGFFTLEKNSAAHLLIPVDGGWVRLDSIDLTDIHQVSLGVERLLNTAIVYTFELRLDTPDGKKIGEFEFKAPLGVQVSQSAKSALQTRTVKLEAITHGKRHHLYLLCKTNGKDAKNALALSFLQLLSP